MRPDPRDHQQHDVGRSYRKRHTQDPRSLLIPGVDVNVHGSSLPQGRGSGFGLQENIRKGWRCKAPKPRG